MRLAKRCEARTVRRSAANISYYNIRVNITSCVWAGMTSSCLCKKAEGVVLPLLIELLKNRIDDSLHAGHIHEQDHGPGAPPNFHEATLDGVGGAQLAPQRLREIEERQQVRQIALQPFHQSRDRERASENGIAGRPRAPA